MWGLTGLVVFSRKISAMDSHLLGVILLLAVFTTQVKTDPPPGTVQRECRDRYFYIWIERSFLLGRNWSIDASDESLVRIPLTPQFAATCGFTVTSDKRGNLEIRVSFLACLVQNDNDDTFALTMHLSVENQFIPHHFSTYTFSMTCGLGYHWSSREIVCEENYMEVSVRRLFPGIAEEQMETEDWEAVIPAAQEAITSVWQIVFQMGEGENLQLKTMTTTEAHSLGYGVNTTASRVVFRAPYNSTESSIIMIDNMPVESIKATVFYKQRWLILLVDSSTACPVGPGILKDDRLVWPTPRVLEPLVFPANITADMITMGVEGKLLDDETLQRRGYDLHINASVIAIAVPVGAVGGWSKSHAINNTYGIIYSIYLLLEHQWLDHLQELTQHRVYRLVSTPFIPKVLYLIDTDATHPKQHFNISVGPFLPDVELVSITVAGKNLSVNDMKKHGYNIYPTYYPNDTMDFIVVADVGAPFIKQQYLYDDIRRYTMNMTLNFATIPDNVTFATPVVITVDVHDVVLPVMKGHCLNDTLYLLLQHGDLDHYWLPYVADEPLTYELAQSYGYMALENGTHFSLEVPFHSPGVVYEEVSLHELQARISFSLKDNQTLKVYSSFTVQCNFSIPEKEVLVCFQNGTVAITVKPSVTLPEIDLSKLVLKDPKCGPKEHNAMKALFVFDINSCGTIGRITNDFLIYENEISYLREAIPIDIPIITRDPDYRLTILCRYPINETLTIQARFGHIPMGFQLPDSVSLVRQTLKTEERNGLNLHARLARDLSYTTFYKDEDYPVPVHLNQPLYFEIELYNQDPNVELFLENCWATPSEELAGQPQWDIIVDGCANHMETYTSTFHPVLTKDVENPFSLKRFEVKTLVSNNSGGLEGLVYFHCNVAICDLSNPDSLCRRTCSPSKRGGHTITHSTREFHGAVSSGPINILTRVSQSPNETTGAHWKLSRVVLLAVGIAVVSSLLLLAVIYLVKSRCY
ncbi:uncharacterized protein LOC122548349 [Chiloscyllium plagiosum]|uniref:uncharacterized protein LOC122548349 n=1 Tax=Chiloscyllium plagiosum TaxID=36176 RepID=UPI001CB879E1|nr:uncharacterized protein LOC122548349 [Chiloscyllium plagiosum]